MELGNNQKAWIKALTSGKYKQSEGHLEFDGGYCCLGVACKVAEENGIKLEYYDKEISGKCLTSQPNVKDWLGLTTSDGKFYEEDYCTSLAELNDSGIPFKKIADSIKEKAEQLFSESK